jgi:N-methylhydantoinase B/oxoprolinase/acetone carboxylase alpha subunit
METIVTGGGGYGKPFDREPGLVLWDVLNEYVSVESAKRWYGVAIDEKAMKVDQTATRNLRSRNHP